MTPTYNSSEHPTNATRSVPVFDRLTSLQVAVTIVVIFSFLIYPTGATIDPTKDATDNPSPAPTGSPLAPKEEKSQLTPKKKDNEPDGTIDGEGQCNFTCWQCLQQIDIAGGGGLWDLAFRTLNETANCSCPYAEGKKTKDGKTVEVVGVTNDEYYLEIERYQETQNGNGNVENVEYGLRINVKQWRAEEQDCAVNYVVNQNEFFGIQAQNILRITFQICDLEKEELTDDALIKSSIEYKNSFAVLFQVELFRVNVSIDIGIFCNSGNGNDEQVTVIIVFSSANDAATAQQNACHDAKAANPDIPDDGCEVETLTQPVKTEDIIFGLNAFKFIIIIISMVIFYILIFIILYCLTSFNKRKNAKKLDLKYREETTKRITSIAILNEEKEKNVLNVSRKSLPQMAESIEMHNMIIDITNINKSSHVGLDPDLVASAMYENNTGATEILMHNQQNNGHNGHNAENSAGNLVPYNKLMPVPSTAEQVTTIAQTNEHQYKSEQEMIEEVINSNKANEIKIEDLIMGKQIGRGQFGTVFKAKWEGNTVVIKTLNADSTSNNMIQENIERQQQYQEFCKEINTKYNQYDLLAMDDDELEDIITRGFPYDNDFMDMEIKLKGPMDIDGSWESLEFDGKNKLIHIGMKDFDVAKIENIKREEQIVYIENVSGEFQITCVSVKHSKWLEEKILVFKKVALRKKLKQKGYPEDNDYLEMKVKLKICNDENHEGLWEELELNRKNVMIYIGTEELVPTEITSIRKEDIIVFVECGTKNKYEITCQSVKHSKWMKEKLSAFKKRGLKIAEKKKKKLNANSANNIKVEKKDDEIKEYLDKEGAKYFLCHNDDNDNNSNSEADDVELKQEERDRAKEMKAEIILASSLPTHHNLIEIFGYIRSPFGIVMSYMPGDSVQKYVYRAYKKDIDPIPTIIELLIILRKAASGLKFLHQYGLIHRDIACRNILLGKINNNHIELSTEVRISDFGLTRELQNKDSHNSAQNTISNVGPIKWMAPESIRNKEYSQKSDVYMFAITMWEIFYGMEPYIDMNAINVAMGVVHGDRPKTPDPLKYRYCAMPDGYQQLMQYCWAEKPHQRPPFGKIIEELVKIEQNTIRRVP